MTLDTILVELGYRQSPYYREGTEGADVSIAHLLRDAGVNPVRAGTVLADVQMYASLHDGKDVPAARAVVQASASAYTAGFRLVMLVFAGACLAGALVIVLLAVVGRRRGP